MFDHNPKRWLDYANVTIPSEGTPSAENRGFPKENL